MAKDRKMRRLNLQGAVQAGDAQGLSRRHFLAGVAGTAVAAGLNGPKAFSQIASQRALNLAKVAIPTSLTVTSENKISALNDNFEPASSRDRKHGIYAVWHDPEEDGPPEWVQYSWSQAIPISSMSVYWAADRPRPNAPPGSGAWEVKAPASYRILYWNGSDFVPVSNPRGMGLAEDTFNTTTFEEIHTDKVRLEVVREKAHPAGILEWRI